MKKFLPKTVNNPHGFTLIELLVVVSIIAFLAVIGAAAFGNAQKQARDGRRRADVDAIAKAYESNFNAIKGSYKTLAGDQFSSGAIPLDPDSAKSYTKALTPSGCTSDSTCTGFYVCADVEVDNGNATGSDASGIGAAGSGLYYCQKSQQSN